jgi:hypothetical protein
MAKQNFWVGSNTNITFTYDVQNFPICEKCFTLKHYESEGGNKVLTLWNFYLSTKLKLLVIWQLHENWHSRLQTSLLVYYHDNDNENFLCLLYLQN